MRGVVSHIQRLSTHDGEGIRTTLFLKGCNLRCPWCHNPETFSFERQVGVVPKKCNGCRRCLPLCPEKALSYSRESGIELNRQRCRLCMRCIDECFLGVFVRSGSSMSVDEASQQLLIDRAYYQNSNGGVTISGGEPLLQQEFLVELLKRVKEEGIHTIIQTNLSQPFNSHTDELIKLTDLFMVDLKLFDSEKHKQWLGIDNQLIKENTLSLDREKRAIELRTPVVPGVNDTVEEIGRIAQFAAQLTGLTRYVLIPYHPLGLAKYREFSIEPAYKESCFGEKESLKRLKEAAERFCRTAIA